MKLQYPNLFQFFAGYFHEDWHDFSQNDDAVVIKFISECSESEIKSTILELQALLLVALDEKQLYEIVSSDLGLRYDPRPDLENGETMKQWLVYILDKLTRGARQKKRS